MPNGLGDDYSDCYAHTVRLSQLWQRGEESGEIVVGIYRSRMDREAGNRPFASVRQVISRDDYIANFAFVTVGSDPNATVIEKTAEAIDNYLLSLTEWNEKWELAQ